MHGFRCLLLIDDEIALRLIIPANSAISLVNGDAGNNLARNVKQDYRLGLSLIYVRKIRLEENQQEIEYLS